jgi:hypothetical protein
MPSKSDWAIRHNVMTQRYAHLSENKLRDAAMVLSQSLTPQKNHAPLFPYEHLQEDTSNMFSYPPAKPF